MLRETEGILNRPDDVVELDIVEPVPRPFARGVVGTRELLLTDMPASWLGIARPRNDEDVESVGQLGEHGGSCPGTERRRGWPRCRASLAADRLVKRDQQSSASRAPGADGFAVASETFREASVSVSSVRSERATSGPSRVAPWTRFDS